MNPSDDFDGTKPFPIPETAANTDLLTPSECHSIFEQVVRAARSRGVPDVEVTLGADRDALTRFANNTIHQNVAERTRYLSVRPVIGQRTARASTNRLDSSSIESVVDQAIAITRASEPDTDLPPLAEAWPVATVDRYHGPTAACTPAERAAEVATAIDAVRSRDQTAAGIYSTSETVEAILNSNGAFVYHAETLAEFSITAMAADSSGWAKASATARDQVDARALAERAARKAALSTSPIEVSPGRYTVILEPSAVLDLTGELYGDFSATAMEDQNSFLNERLGKPIFGSNINITDNAYHHLQDGAPFDGEGVARAKLGLVEDGVPTDIAYSRKAAGKAGVEPTGHGFALPNDSGEGPANIVFEGGDTSIEEMIASTERGILVTRCWYIREVDPYEKIMTGMTRDGTFLIENGEVVGGLRNFRFNQGLIELLSNVEALSPSARASGEEAFDMVVPAMKVHNFHFTELTRF